MTHWNAPNASHAPKFNEPLLWETVHVVWRKGTSVFIEKCLEKIWVDDLNKNPNARLEKALWFTEWVTF